VFTRFVRALHLVENSLLVGALVAMLGMALMQILLRNLFDSGFLWAESALRILVLWVAMLGALVATRQGNHISIDLLGRYLGLAGRRTVRALNGVIASVICGVAAWYAFVFVGYEYQDETIAFASVPTWACQAILPMGFAGMSLRFMWAALTSRPE
jgi:TRAP-type C4-dicarboxylate transport system permease small subunit